MEKTKDLILRKIESFGEVKDVYPAEYTKKYEVRTEKFYESDSPDARKLRDRRAKELRAEGWEVECSSTSFPDIDDKVYELEARRERVKKASKPRANKDDKRVSKVIAMLKQDGEEVAFRRLIEAGYCETEAADLIMRAIDRELYSKKETNW